MEVSEKARNFAKFFGASGRKSFRRQPGEDIERIAIDKFESSTRANVREAPHAGRRSDELPEIPKSTKQETAIVRHPAAAEQTLPRGLSVKHF